MKLPRFAILTGAVAVLLTSFALPAYAGAKQGVNPFAYRLLESQNHERVRVGAPPLEWSAKLAADAQLWADHLAQRGTLEHASYEARHKAGENLWMGSAGYYSAEDMIGGFIDERRNFVPGKFPDVSRTGRWQDVAHYTQLIWKDTREVGCAVARGRVNDFLVCRYFPVGNWIGQPIG